MNWYEKIDIIQEIQWKKIPKFNLGNLLNLTIQLNKIDPNQRIQNYNGILIAIYYVNTNARIIIRRLFLKIRIEQIFIINSRTIKSIQIKQFSSVHHIKIYYLRNREGKAINLQIRRIYISK